MALSDVADAMQNVADVMRKHEKEQDSSDDDEPDDDGDDKPRKDQPKDLKSAAKETKRRFAKQRGEKPPADDDEK